MITILDFHACKEKHGKEEKFKREKRMELNKSLIQYGTRFFIYYLTIGRVC